ncbi:hypothetical protein C6496_06335 [Candidatus Poribacteria bacterium]|nr:MAG: hypothetical protein C6496_06335 [Candidatus Poribacteria bacterium]
MTNLAATHRWLIFVLAGVLLTLGMQGMSLGQGGKKIYWTEWDGRTQTGNVRRAHLDGSYVKDVVTDLKDPRSIALDTLRRKVYWTDYGTGKIQRADFTGRNIKDIVTGFKIPAVLHIACDENGCKGEAFPHNGGKIELPHEALIDPYGLALNPGDRKIYWGNNLRGTIQSADLNGSSIKDILDIGIDVPINFAIQVGGDKIYWINTERKAKGGKIQRANLDGSNLEDIVTGLRGPHGIALDMISRKLYWTADGNKIQRANLDGSQIEDIITGLGNVDKITLDPVAGKIYWVSYTPDTGIGKIQRANLDGSKIKDLITGLGYVWEITLYSQGAYTVAPSPDKLITTWAEMR